MWFRASHQVSGRGLFGDLARLIHLANVVTAARTVRGLQQFVCEGGWDDAALPAKHRRLVNEDVGKDDGILIVDGSGFPKHGSHSADVPASGSGTPARGHLPGQRFPWLR